MRQSAIAFLIAIAACGGSDTSTAPAAKTVVGSYALVTYKGSAPPVVALEDPANSLKIEILGSTFIIGGTTYSTAINIRTTDHGVVTTSSYTCTGSYVFGQNILAFTEVESGQFCGGTYVANWDAGDTLTFHFKNGESGVYKR
jgi:hypothetical protein